MLNSRYSHKKQLGRVYVVPQPYVGIYPLSEALKKGNLFPNLYMPYKN